MPATGSLSPVSSYDERNLEEQVGAPFPTSKKKPKETYLVSSVTRYGSSGEEIPLDRKGKSERPGDVREDRGQLRKKREEGGRRAYRSGSSGKKSCSEYIKKEED